MKETNVNEHTVPDPYIDPETLASLKRGLADAAAGRLSDLGSFAQYAEDEDSD